MLYLCTIIHCIIIYSFFFSSWISTMYFKNTASRHFIFEIECSMFLWKLESQAPMYYARIYSWLEFQLIDLLLLLILFPFFFSFVIVDSFSFYHAFYPNNTDMGKNRNSNSSTYLRIVLYLRNNWCQLYFIVVLTWLGIIFVIIFTRVIINYFDSG